MRIAMQAQDVLKAIGVKVDNCSVDSLVIESSNSHMTEITMRGVITKPVERLKVVKQKRRIRAICN